MLTKDLKKYFFRNNSKIFDKELWLNVMNALPDCISFLDKEYNLIWYNTAIEKQFGANIAGKKCYAVFYGRSTPCKICQIDKIFADGITRTHVHPLKKNNHGSNISFWCTASVISYDEKGQPNLIIKTSRDITKRKKAESTLRKCMQQCRNLTAFAPVGIFKIDTDGKIKYTNQIFCKMFQEKDAVIKEKGFFHFIYPQDRKRLKIMWLRMLRENMPQIEASFRVRLNDGKTRWMLGQLNVEVKNNQMAKSYIPTAFQDVTRRKRSRAAEHTKTYVSSETSLQQSRNLKGEGYIGTITDFTEQHYLEEELHRRSQQLMLINRAQSLGELSSHIAHQLNQPLTIISCYIQECIRLINEKGCDDNDKLIEVMSKINTQAIRASELIHHIRKYYSNNKQLYKKELNLNAVIKEVAMLCEENNTDFIPIILKLDASLPLVEFDHMQIKQVVLNILQNAIEAIKESNPKSPKIIVSTKVKDKMVEVTVNDNGCGISAETLKHLSESFFTTKENGMGMGLSICRSIIEQHCGEFSITSPAKKRGATVKFSLPFN